MKLVEKVQKASGMGREKVHEIRRAKLLEQQNSGVDQYVQVVRLTKELIGSQYHAKLAYAGTDKVIAFAKQMEEELKVLNADEETKLVHFAQFTALFDEHDLDKDSKLNQSEFVALR